MPHYISAQLYMGARGITEDLHPFAQLLRSACCRDWESLVSSRKSPPGISSPNRSLINTGSKKRKLHPFVFWAVSHGFIYLDFLKWLSICFEFQVIWCTPTQFSSQKNGEIYVANLLHQAQVLPADDIAQLAMMASMVWTTQELLCLT